MGYRFFMTRILIDGYNLLAVSGHKNRDHLIEAFRKYQQAKGHQITVIFDGTHGGTGSGDRYFESSVEVIFSPLTVTADDMIEKMLSSSEASGTIVVSSDRRIQSAAKRVGSTYVESKEFARKLLNTLISSSSSEVPIWLEGRLEETDNRIKTRKGASKKLSKEERQRRRKLNRL